MMFIKAHYINISAQIPNYAEHHGKSESGAFAASLVVKNGSKTRSLIAGNADTIIGNGDLNLVVSLMGCMTPRCLPHWYRVRCSLGSP